MDDLLSADILKCLVRFLDLQNIFSPLIACPSLFYFILFERIVRICRCILILQKAAGTSDVRSTYGDKVRKLLLHRWHAHTGSAVQTDIPSEDWSYPAVIPGSAAAARFYPARYPASTPARPIVYGCPGCSNKSSIRRLLHHKTTIHDDDTVAELCHNAKIMCDENDAGPVFFFQLPQSAAGSDPESSHPELWSAHRRSAAPACSPDAMAIMTRLTHTAGKLMRITAIPLLRLRNPHLFETAPALLF